MEKKWASKGGLQATSEATEIICNFNESPAGGGGAMTYISKNSRRLSLEESILANHVAQILPPLTRSRGVTVFIMKFSRSLIRNALLDFNWTDECSVHQLTKLSHEQLLRSIVLCALFYPISHFLVFACRMNNCISFHFWVGRHGRRDPLVLRLFSFASGLEVSCHFALV